MKRKVAAGSMALVVLGGGLWLGALAWSRHEVQSRMAEQVADINALTGIRAINTIKSDGFFSSRGSLRVIMTDSDADAEAPAGVIDWRVAYGVLSTRLSGHGDIRLRDGKALLADELSEGHELDVEARIQHLSRDMVLNARFPDAMHYQGHGMSLNLSGARISMVDDDQGLRVQGDWSELAHESAERQVHMGETHWSVRFPGENAESINEDDSSDRPGRVDRLDISDARLQRQGGLPLTLSNLHLEGSTHHDRQELSYLLRAQLGNATFSEQQLGSASLDAAVRRINEPAARALLKTMARDIRKRWQGARQPAPGAGMQEERGADPRLVDDLTEVDDVHDIASLMVPWQENFFAILSNSPRLVVNQLQLESPMLDQQMHLNGELTLEGTDIATTRIEQLQTSWGRAAFKRRLDGHFTLHNAPPLLALVAGQAPDQDTLELAIRKGVFLINGEPWFLLN